MRVTLVRFGMKFEGIPWIWCSNYVVFYDFARGALSMGKGEIELRPKLITNTYTTCAKVIK